MNHTLIVALIQNAGLLMAMVVVFDVLSARQKQFAVGSRRVLVGVAIGSIGIAMIEVSVHLGAGIVFDTRSVLLAVSGLFLGTWPTVVALLMTAAFRLSLGGAAAWTGVAVILASGAIGIAWRRLRRRPIEDVSWQDLYALGLVVHGVMLALMFTLPWETGLRVVRAVGVPIMVVHPLATVALGLLFVRRLQDHRTAVVLAKSETRFRLLAENARDLIYRFEFTPNRGFAYVSPSSTGLTGYAPEEYYADPDLGFNSAYAADRPIVEAMRRGEFSPEPLVLRLKRKNGEIIWIEQRNTPVLDEHGNLIAVEGIARDITGSKWTDAMLRLALKAADQGIYDLNIQTGEAAVSEEYARMLGYEPAEFHETNDAWIERLHPDDRDVVAAAYRDYVAGRLPEYRMEFRQRTKSGDWVWILSLGSLVAWDAEGKPLRMMGTHTDITALKLAEQQTRDAQAQMAGLLGEAEQSRRALLSLVEDQQAAERRLLAAQQLAQSTLDALKEQICVLDTNGGIIAVNEAWNKFGAANGARPEAILVGANYLAVCDAATGPDAEQAREVAAALRAVLEGRRNAFATEYPCHSPREERWFESQVTRVSGIGPARLVVAHVNITERKKAESDLKRLAQILEASQVAARVGGWELDLVHDSIFWTDETYRIHDTSPAEYTPTPASVVDFFTPESVPGLREALREAIKSGATRDVETELITFTGRRKWVHITTSVTAEQGRTVRVTCAFQDITARKLAEQEQAELTARLHQARRLESLGSLAGGVAHDINNVLAAILSLASAHRRQMKGSDPLARALDTITNACVRGRSVVRSLLYFVREDIESRGPVDLNAIAREIVHLLGSTTLKRIRYATDLEEPLTSLDGDAAAISHAVMNLCVNSVDAMPEGGAVTIRTRTRSDGFVEISVRDMGTGMTPEVRQRAIEPFFTTKPVGKGTGLGLAMVYGTVKAHKGTLEIISAPGQGTEVILAFPGTPGGAPPAAVATPPAGKAVSQGPLRILLVDDDELIRDAVGALLEMEGHEVHLAEGGAEGLARFASGLEVDLVILDMNMPGLTGAQTLVRLLALRPEQLVLLCSGYWDEEMVRMLAGRPNVLGIQKPFTLDELDGKLSALGLRG